MNIALVAHDARKKELCEWFGFNVETLSKHTLYATGTTARLLNEVICDYFAEHGMDNCGDFAVNGLLSGPLGGDAQISAMIAEGKVDILIFFCDNLITQGHQQDVGALSRLASLYNIPFATNRTTADMILTSNLFDNVEYNRIIPASINNYKNREIPLAKKEEIKEDENNIDLNTSEDD